MGSSSGASSSSFLWGGAQAELRPAWVPQGVQSCLRESRAGCHFQYSQEAGGQQQPLASRLVGKDILQEVVDVSHSDPCGRAKDCRGHSPCMVRGQHSLLWASMCIPGGPARLRATSGLRGQVSEILHRLPAQGGAGVGPGGVHRTQDLGRGGPENLKGAGAMAGTMTFPSPPWSGPTQASAGEAWRWEACRPAGLCKGL